MSIIGNKKSTKAELGASRALGEKLNALELERDRREYSLRELEKTHTYEPISAEEIQVLLRHIKPALERQPLNIQQAILRNLLNHIDIDRDGKTLIIGLLFRVPPKKKDNSVPTSNDPLGAPVCRHIFQYVMKKSHV